MHSMMRQGHVRLEYRLNARSRCQAAAGDCIWPRCDGSRTSGEGEDGARADSNAIVMAMSSGRNWLAR